MRIILALSLLAAALMMTTGGAKAFQFSSYTSSIQLQNLDATAGTISLIFYDQAGNIVTTVSDTLDANGQKYWFPLPQGVNAGFNGSVVVTSTTNVASISNIIGGNLQGNASYVADSAGNTTLSLPVLMQNNSSYYTWFNIQNAGTVDANLTVAYSDGTTATFNGLKPGASHTFDQSAETHTAKFFAGTVTSNVPVVGTAIVESTKILQAYTAFKSGNQFPVMPLVNVQPNRAIQTGINLSNSGNTETTVTVSYKASTGFGEDCTEQQTIPAGGMKVFSLFTFSGTAANLPGTVTTCKKGVTFVGSAKVTENTANQPLSIIVNQLTSSTAGSSYGAFDASTATGKFVSPLVMDRNNATLQLYTSINMMNVGTVDTTVTCVFTGAGATKPYTTPNLTPNSGTFHIQAKYFPTAPYVGGATCTANTPGAKIIAVVNEAAANPGTADWNMSFEAVNVP